MHCQAKQNAIAGFLNRAGQVQIRRGRTRCRQPGRSASKAALPAQQAGACGAQNIQAGQNMDVEAPADVSGDDGGSSQLVMMPGPAAPQPRTAARPMKSSFLDNAMKQFAALWHGVGERIHTATASAPRGRNIPATYAQHPALRALAEQTSARRRHRPRRERADGAHRRRAGCRAWAICAT